MKRNYIQPKSENISFNMEEGILTLSKIGVDTDGSKGSVTGSTMGTNELDWEDDIEWDEE